MSDMNPVPSRVIELVNQYVHRERSDAERFTNREPFDNSGVWSLHELARSIYAAGWSDGYRAHALADQVSE
jgi:hypothetical protein